MKKLYDEIVYSRSKYKDREELYNAIATQLMLLMDNEYVCKIYDDDKDIICIQYAHNNNIDDWGSPYLEWLNDKEVDLIELNREEEK